MRDIKKIYWSPTPVFFRKVGDALLAASTIGTTYAIVNDYKWVGLTLLILGVVGKFISNLATEEKPIECSSTHL